MEKKVNSKSYTLRDERGNWLGQIVLTDDGMFASVTDWGNLSNSWRTTGDNDFRKFLCSLDTDYFATKIYSGMSYVISGKKVEQACKRFAERILPPLQKVLKEELENGIGWE